VDREKREWCPTGRVKEGGEEKDFLLRCLPRRGYTQPFSIRELRYLDEKKGRGGKRRKGKRYTASSHCSLAGEEGGGKSYLVAISSKEFSSSCGYFRKDVLEEGKRSAPVLTYRTEKGLSFSQRPKRDRLSSIRGGCWMDVSKGEKRKLPLLLQMFIFSRARRKKGKEGRGLDPVSLSNTKMEKRYPLFLNTEEHERRGGKKGEKNRSRRGPV